MRNSVYYLSCLLLSGFSWISTHAQPYTVVDTFAGRGQLLFNGDGGLATSAPLVSPMGIAMDADHNFYVADQYYAQVFKITPQGRISVFAGAGNGAGTASGVSALSTTLAPSGVAVGPSGDVYITDSQSNLVYKVDQKGNIKIFAGTGGQGSSGDLGPATSAKLNQPFGVAAGLGGDVFIAETAGHRIRKVDRNGIITTFAGTGVLDNGLENVLATKSPVPFPYGVAVDSVGNVYYTEGGNSRVRKVDTKNIVQTVAGTGIPGYAGDGGPAVSAALQYPYMVAVDQSNNVFVADFGNQRVRRVSYVGYIQTIAGTGTGGYSGDGGQAQKAQISEPAGVTVDDAGNVYFTEAGGRRVREIVAADTTIRTIAGTGVTIPLGDGGPPRSAYFISPNTVVSDGAGTFYITDIGNDCVRKITPDGKISTVAGTGIPGYNGDNQPASAAHLNSPHGLALDSQGNLYIADTDSHRVRKVTRDGMIQTVAGTGTRGYNGEKLLATESQLNSPRDIAFDRNGNLYIADVNNYRVRKVTPAGIMTTVAGDGSWNFYGDGGPAVGAALRWPFSVAVNSAGDLYIADPYNNRIRKVSASTGNIMTITGTAESGYNGDNILATQATLNQPYDVAVDAQDNLYISDTQNYRLRKVSPKGIITTVAGGGSSLPIQDGILASETYLGGIGRPWLHPDGTIYLPVSDAARVLKVYTGQIARESAVNAASFVGGGVSPGEIVAIFGDQIGPAQLVGTQLTPDGLRFSTQNSGVQAFFDDVAAPLVWVASGAASAIVPYSVAGKTTTRLKIVWQGKATNEVDVPVVPVAPGLFTMASGTGQGAICNQDLSVNSESNPVDRDSIVVLYATGEGQTSPGGTDGKIAVGVYPKPVLPVEVKIGGVTAELQYFGAAPYLVAGAMQVNARVPKNITPGKAVPVQLIVGGKPSQDGVTLAVR